jgi:uncharacterized RDD family membrane protein YckC
MTSAPDDANVNPYAAPAAISESVELSPTSEPNTVASRAPRSDLARILPRLLAAQGDFLLSAAFALFLASRFPDSARVMQGVAAFTFFFGYYFFSEWIFSATPGKFLAGIKVAQTNRQPITSGQSAIRTLMRIVEANPILLGALPAAASIVLSKQRQRLGDMLAGTVVVRSR